MRPIHAMPPVSRRHASGIGRSEEDQRVVAWTEPADRPNLDHDTKGAPGDGLKGRQA